MRESIADEQGAMQSRRNQPAQESDRAHRARAVVALLLLVPAPSVGVYFGMWDEATAGTTVGDAFYGAAKVWLLALPLVWLLLVQRGRLSWSPPRRGGIGFGIGSGLAIAAVIGIAYVQFGETLIDPQSVRDAAERVGLDSPLRFVLLAAYLCLINALLEEYVWRWFCFRQCERIISAGRGMAAVALSALFFTLHHIIALAAQFDAPVVILGSAGVFIGGCVWSYCYLRYRSIWPGYVSHVIVDIAVLAVGWHIIFS